MHILSFMLNNNLSNQIAVIQSDQLDDILYIYYLYLMFGDKVWTLAEVFK